MQAPAQVTAGQVFTVTVGPFHKPKSGFVAIYPPNAGDMFSVTRSEADWKAPAFAISNDFSGVSATVSITAPSGWSSPTAFSLQAIVPADGGTLDRQNITVVPAAAPPPPPSAVAPVPPVIQPQPPQLTAQPIPMITDPGFNPNSASQRGLTPTPSLNPYAPPGAPVYTAPSPEPAASDGAKLSMQGADLQAYYVANAGPGMLAATAFVIDHEHQLAAIGSSHAPAPGAYTAPANEPAASDGEKLSMQSADVQAYYVNKYGPGFLAGVGFVNERNASLGTSIPGGAPVVLPAGPGAGGPNTGLIGGGGSFSTLPTGNSPTGAAVGMPPPAFGNLVTQVTSNKPLLIGLLAAGYFLLGGEIPSLGHHRR